MKRKLTLESVLGEADVLQKDQNLKFNIVQKLPHYMKVLMQQIKSDQYDQAIQTLLSLSAAAQEAQQQLTAVVQQNKNPNDQQKISNKEI